jgi:hypothetical protein
MLHMDPPDPVPAVSGHLLLDDLPAATVEELVAAAGPGAGSPLASVELRQTGGALARSGPSSGALASVPGSLAMFAVGSAFSEPEAEAMQRQIRLITEALRPRAVGRLLNFTEQPCDTGAAFPEDAYRRLREIRAAYDPDGVMHANHPVAAG